MGGRGYSINSGSNMKSKFFESLVTKESLNHLCYTNADIIKGKIKGVVTDFHGFGSDSMKNEPKEHDVFLAENGILTVYPFYSPWAWANETCIAFCDKIIDTVYGKYSLSAEVPLAICGESMGGMTAFNFSVYTNRKFVCVAACCPVCDLNAMNKSRIDILRALCAAYGSEDRTYTEAVAHYSPIFLVDKFKDVPYMITQGGRDVELDGSENATALVAKMKDMGFDVTYLFDAEMEHCHMNKAMHREYFDFIINKLKGAK